MRWWALPPVRATLDLMAPRECCACGRRLHDPLENGLCWDCRGAVSPLSPPWCEVCGVRVAGRVDHAFVCADCRANPPHYDRGRSLYAYEGGLREAIHALKYRRDFSVVPDLARLLVAGLRVHGPAEEAGWTLTPVPLHRKRFAHRGFNQGEELIREARRIEPGIRLWRGLRKVKDTESQTRLSKAARRGNVRGAFAAAPGPAPSVVVLVDDVMTTGATLDACALTLKRRAKVNTVYTLTLARG